MFLVFLKIVFAAIALVAVFMIVLTRLWVKLLGWSIGEIFLIVMFLLIIAGCAVIVAGVG